MTIPTCVVIFQHAGPVNDVLVEMAEPVPTKDSTTSDAAVHLATRDVPVKQEVSP